MLILDFLLTELMIAIYSVGISIVTGVYKVAALIFKIFFTLADGTLIEKVDTQTIISNFYLIIGIVMLFVLSFSMLKGMVNPDDNKQGTSVIKSVIINFLTSSIIIVLLPSIFGFLYDFQEAFVTKYNPIGKLFGYGSLESGIESTANTIEGGAYKITNAIFTAFFNANLDECGGTNLQECQAGIYNADNNLTLSAAITNVDATGKFGVYKGFADKVESDRINFDFLLGLICGLFVCYVAISFCFDMAVRMVKLVFYQIIAPVPIFLRIAPNNSKPFDTWVKDTLSCYFEVYTRIFAFYFAVCICTKMLEADLFANLGGAGLFAKAFLMMGIVMFMKQAPKLISDVTGIKSGDMKLGIRDKFKEGGAFAAFGALGGGIGGAIAGMKYRDNQGENKWSQARGAMRGFASGAVSGFRYGTKNADMKSVGAGFKRALRNEEVRANPDSTLGGRIDARLRDYFGWETKEEELTRKNDNYINAENNKRMKVKNETGVDIGEVDDNGNVINGKVVMSADPTQDTNEVDLSKGKVEELEELKSRVIEKKSKNGLKVDQLKERQSQNESLAGSKGKIDSLAEKEMMKGKMLLKTFNESTGQYDNLTLSYASGFDQQEYNRKAKEIATTAMENGSYRLKGAYGEDLRFSCDITELNGAKSTISLEHGTLDEWEKLLKANRSKMSAADVTKLERLIDDSKDKWTTETFIRTNGVENVLQNGKELIVDGEIVTTAVNSDILEAQKNCITYTTATNLTQSQAEAFVSSHRDKMSTEDLKRVQAALDKSIKVDTKEFFIDYNGADYALNADGDIATDSSGRRLFTEKDGKVAEHADTLAAKRAIAFDIIQKGFVTVDGTRQNIAYESLLKNLKDKGIDTKSPDFKLEDYLDTAMLKALKDEGENLNRGEIASAQREIQFVQAKLDKQIKSIDRVLESGKEQQDIQKRSNAYRAARVNAKVIQDEKKK